MARGFKQGRGAHDGVGIAGVMDGIGLIDVDRTLPTNM